MIVAVLAVVLVLRLLSSGGVIPAAAVVVVAGLVLFYLVDRAVRRIPYVVCDKEGVSVRGLLSVEALAWKEIESVEVFEVITTRANCDTLVLNGKNGSIHISNRYYVHSVEAMLQYLGQQSPVRTLVGGEAGARRKIAELSRNRSATYNRRAFYFLSGMFFVGAIAAAASEAYEVAVCALCIGGVMIYFSLRK